MAVSRITAYQSGDGSIFGQEDEAIQHQRGVDFRIFLDDLVTNNAAFDFDVDGLSEIILDSFEVIGR